MASVSSHLEALTCIDGCLLILPSANEPAPPMQDWLLKEAAFPQEVRDGKVAGGGGGLFINH